nr:immunoglobulin light chain junction region [Macaca mulatta]
CQQHYSYPLTF